MGLAIPGGKDCFDLGEVKLERSNISSLTLRCPMCGLDQFRDINDYFNHPEWHICLWASYWETRDKHTKPGDECYVYPVIYPTGELLTPEYIREHGLFKKKE